jgi:hypothetical protein
MTPCVNACLFGDAGEVLKLLLGRIAEHDLNCITELGVILEEGAACGKCCTKTLLQPSPYFSFPVPLICQERDCAAQALSRAASGCTLHARSADNF